MEEASEAESSARARRQSSDAQSSSSPQVAAPPSSDASDGASSQLAELFHAHEAARACLYLQGLTPKHAAREISSAFVQVEWAPYAFLLALSQWPPTASRTAFFSLISAGVESMHRRLQLNGTTPSLTTCNLAGSLLLQSFHDSRPLLVAAFVTAFGIDPTYVQHYCTRLMAVHINHAVTVVDELNLHVLLPLDGVIHAAIEQNELHAADVFVRKDPNHQRIYIQALIDSGTADKVIKKRLLKFNLEEHAFPAYHERKLKASLRFHIYNQDFEVALNMRGERDLSTRLFVHQAEISNDFHQVDCAGLEGQSFPNKDDLDPIESCLSLEDLVSADACEFVDTEERLRNCVNYLRTAPVIGFDCEWKAIAPHGGKSEPCALLQLASATRVFVVDTIALKYKCESLREIFLSETIVKLGFDTKGDLTVLSHVLLLDGDPSQHGSVKNLVDLQALEKRLRHLKQVRVSRNNEHDRNPPLKSTLQENEECRPSSSVDANQTPGNKNAQLDGCTQPAEMTQKEQDVRPLSSSRNFNSPNTQKPCGGSDISLASVTEAYLGKPLDKRSRMSDWERRPLTQAQLHYAALDALVLVAIYESMEVRFSTEVLNEALNHVKKVNRPRASKKRFSSWRNGI